MFPDRKTAELTYRLTGPWGQLFNDVLDYARELVERAEGRGQREQRMNWWAALALLRSGTIVVDVVLHGIETATLRLARLAGFPTQDGMPMVRHQAVRAFWLVNQVKLEAKGLTEADVARVIT